uniref:Uncharacterized protein n=1 Tax=Candidatus Kentrum sp. FM TaxID=2126340 RepID=A0A450S7R7_9GAMM|nr:MAG: hypothetical protein BECKFM1743A_GA0114220_100537 [Candidatus Kentron sp. FM]VFJ48025.1 MAG: hypothetical protein BECKFM1743C_GA0114222_100537 [Candidatus Kentron sp. FM]VFK07684.1 MAG: hypothetical protein BECKFM1743B_GA0114221_100487 [Candidatus Kentron sp. FM]
MRPWFTWHEMSIIEFWKDNSADLDLDRLREMSVSVKGKSHRNPCRCLEIFGNYTKPTISHDFSNHVNLFDSASVSDFFLPRIPGVSTAIGSGIYHPPFLWKDSSPESLGNSFTYITNAFYRIFSNIANRGIVPNKKVDGLLDDACQIISHIYRIQDGFILKHINNNINMYIISRIAELLLTKEIYDSLNQEPMLVDKTLDHTLNNIYVYESFPVISLMGFALGRGIAFLEKTMINSDVGMEDKVSVDDRTNSVPDQKFTIDYRWHLIDRVEKSNAGGKSICMCVILDDTSESVFDLLWIQKMIKENHFLKIILLVNTAQISINFTSSMLRKILAHQSFAFLASKVEDRFFVCETFCPLISFQTNMFQEKARRIINKSDFVYVKGLNFFETCQIKEKDTYHAYVVYGPIARLYSGLEDYSPIFAYIPRGREGYVHNKDERKVVSLSDCVVTFH